MIDKRRSESRCLTSTRSPNVEPHSDECSARCLFHRDQRALESPDDGTDRDFISRSRREKVLIVRELRGFDGQELHHMNFPSTPVVIPLSWCGFSNGGQVASQDVE